MMGACSMIHEIRVWLECTLSAQLITDALWMCQHGFTENATITRLSHFVSCVCIFLLGECERQTIRWSHRDQVPHDTVEPLKYKQGMNRRTIAHLQWRPRGISSFTESAHQALILKLLTLKSSFFPPAVPHCSSSHYPVNSDRKRFH